MAMVGLVSIDQSLLLHLVYLDLDRSDVHDNSFLCYSYLDRVTLLNLGSLNPVSR